jgi:hypothetical protein
MSTFLGLLSILGFFACLVWLIIRLFKRSGRKKPLMGLGVCVVLFIVAIVIPPSFESGNTKSTVVEPEILIEKNSSEGATVNPVKTTKGESRIETEVTDGEVFKSISQIWTDVKIVEVYDEEAGSILARIDVYVNEASPLDNAKKYIEIVSSISDNCSDVFTKADYNKVVLHFKVSNFEGSIFFFTELVSKDGKYFINGFTPYDIIALSDGEYQKAIDLILEDQYKQSCEQYQYKDIARNPREYDGKKAFFNGKVIQVLESGNQVDLRVNVTKGEYGFYDDTIYVEYQRKDVNEPRILEDDIIAIWGNLDGLETYTAVLGQTVSIPKLKMLYYELIN